MKKFLVFEEYEWNGGKRYAVRNHKRDVLGEIELRKVGRRQRWVMVAEHDPWDGVWWTHECLSQVVEFMANLEVGAGITPNKRNRK